MPVLRYRSLPGHLPEGWNTLTGIRSSQGDSRIHTAPSRQRQQKGTDDMKGTEQRVAVITGASQGLGLEIARVYARHNIGLIVTASG